MIRETLLESNPKLFYANVDNVTCFFNQLIADAACKCDSLFSVEDILEKLSVWKVDHAHKIYSCLCESKYFQIFQSHDNINGNNNNNNNNTARNMLPYCICGTCRLFVVKISGTQCVCFIVKNVGSKISKTVLFLLERDNCAIWFCCFPKIQLNFNCKETLKVAICFSLSEPESILRYQE